MLYEYIISLPFTLDVNFGFLRGKYKIRIDYIGNDLEHYTLMTYGGSPKDFNAADKEVTFYLKELIDKGLYKDMLLKDALVVGKFRGWLNEDC